MWTQRLKVRACRMALAAPGWLGRRRISVEALERRPAPWLGFLSGGANACSPPELGDPELVEASGQYEAMMTEVKAIADRKRVEEEARAKRTEELRRINELIAHPFGLARKGCQEEETLAHYVSLLKAIALRTPDEPSPARPAGREGSPRPLCARPEAGALRALARPPSPPTLGLAPPSLAGRRR